ncbi:MAG: hypothetical protein ACYTHM_19280, partial [Planctomycetota bacterium]
PEIEVTVVKPPDTRKDLFGPVEVAFKVLPDFRVELTWKPDPRTSAKVKGYEVFRWKDGEKQPEKPVSGGLLSEPEFTDDDFNHLIPRTTVHYAVRAHTEEDVKQDAKTADSAPVKVALPDDRTVLYFGEKQGLEMAVLYVKRFYKGEWVGDRFTVNLGEPVGRESTIELELGGEKARIDFSTGKLLVEINEKEITEKIVEVIPKLDKTGAPVTGPDGKPVMVKKVRQQKVRKGFVVLVDDGGKDQKIFQTKKVVEPKERKAPAPDDPYLDHVLYDLGKQLDEAKKQKLPGKIQRMFRKRRAYLEKNRKRLVGPPGKVDDNLLAKDKGLLFKLRWEWIKAKDKALRFPKNSLIQKNAEDLEWTVKDLEKFLSPAGWDKEKEEWDLDYQAFREKPKFEGREPPNWIGMPPKPEKPRNTEGK